MNYVPTILENEHSRDYSYDIFSRLLKERIIFINGEITDSLSSLVVSELLYLDSISHKDISIYINSPGGSVTAGFAIYDTFNHIKSDVCTIGMGLCASMGAFLLVTGSKNKRYCLPNTEIMIHQPLGGASGQASDIVIAAERINKVKQKINKIISERTNQSIKKISKDTDRDNYFDANEALKYGLIDKII